MDFFNFNLFKTTDILWVSISLIAILILMAVKRREYAGQTIRKYMMPALIWRLVFVFLYGLIVQYYYGSGDTVMYYRGVLDMHHAISDNAVGLFHIFTIPKITETDPTYIYFVYDGWGLTHYYMENVSNFNVSRFALPFSLMFGGSYIAISFCLSLFSFAGCWRIFKMFREMYPPLERHFAIGILFLPSILFWGGSLLKDSICLGAMGFCIYACYQAFITKRKVIISLLIMLATGLLLLYIKPYILLCLAPGLLVWMFLDLRGRIVNRSVRNFTGFFLLATGLIAGAYAFQAITKTEIASQYSSDKILATAQSVQGTFDESTTVATGPDLASAAEGNSLFAVLVSLPVGFVSTFFRPFIFEVRNPLMLISALEGLVFFLITIIVFKRVGFRNFMRTALSDKVVLFCLLFSITFGSIVGATTTNFGALARYKIPCLPFYLFAFFIVAYRAGKLKDKPILHRSLF